MIFRPIFIILAKRSTEIYNFEPEHHNFKIHIYNFSVKLHWNFWNFVLFDKVALCMKLIPKN